MTVVTDKMTNRGRSETAGKIRLGGRSFITHTRLCEAGNSHCSRAGLCEALSQPGNGTRWATWWASVAATGRPSPPSHNHSQCVPVAWTRLCTRTLHVFSRHVCRTHWHAPACQPAPAFPLAAAVNWHLLFVDMIDWAARLASCSHTVKHVFFYCAIRSSIVSFQRRNSVNLASFASSASCSWQAIRAGNSLWKRSRQLLGGEQAASWGTGSDDQNPDKPARYYEPSNKSQTQKHSACNVYGHSVWHACHHKFRFRNLSRQPKGFHRHPRSAPPPLPLQQRRCHLHQHVRQQCVQGTPWATNGIIQRTSTTECVVCIVVFCHGSVASSISQGYQTATITASQEPPSPRPQARNHLLLPAKRG